jgi:[acyl-carrier-protein] S-malonyltransferase
MKIAFVFPGQGSQSLGMLSDIAAHHPLISDTFAEASEVLGMDLWALAQSGPESELNRTELTQPAILTASIALWRLWRDLSGLKPDVVAGHSLGEYSALIAAGVLEFAPVVKLVHLRGKFMQEAVPPGVGAMAAILGLDDDKVVEACLEAAGHQVVSAVNFNSPGQVVIAGHAEAVERAGQACKDKGARRVLPLPVSVPSHCALMNGAAEQLSAALADMPVRAPQTALIQNVTAEPVDDPEQIRLNLVKQLYSPVLWTQSVEKMHALGVGRMVECGPGKVLSGLNKRIVDGLEVFSLSPQSDFNKTLETLGGSAIS